MLRSTSAPSNFDGEIRANLVLSYVNTSQDSIGGQPREVVTCAARFQPVAGYRSTNKGLQYLSTKSKIVLKFAQLGDTVLYAPVQANVSTKVGTFSIQYKFRAPSDRLVVSAMFRLGDA